jgi:hypothetical protein
MTDLSRILKQILSRNKWTDRGTTYVFTQIVFDEGVYEFYVNATQSEDITFLAFNIYGFCEKLILAAFDILDIEDTAYEIKLNFSGPNNLDGKRLTYSMYHVSDKDKQKTLNKFNSLPLIGAIVKDGEVIPYKGKASDFNLDINSTLKSIDFTFYVDFDKEKYGISKNDAQNHIFVDMTNNYMSGFLLSQYENKFITVNDGDWAFLTSITIN